MRATHRSKRDQRRSAVRSFAGALFQPLPLLGNAHVQTLLSAFLPGWPLRLPAEERQVVLDDGDRLVLHDTRPETWQTGAPIALLAHGLGGSHNSGYMRRIAQKLLHRGIRIVRLDLRGCGRGIALARRSYHAGCSSDVRAAALEVHRHAPDSPLWLVGFSLGGNIVLKLAGEAHDEPVPGLARVAALAPPIDLLRCSDLIALPRNRFYERHFLGDLLDLLRQRQRFFPHLRRLRFPRRLSLRCFDDRFTAPQAGFSDALEYYERSAALPLIPRIQVPTLILTARDDPFIPPDPFERLEVPPHIDIHILPRGGHLGFLGRDGAGGIRWADQFLVRWLTRE